jgi:hypothetical protein
MSHGQILRSTSGEPEFAGQKIYEIPASEQVLNAENASSFLKIFFPESFQVNMILEGNLQYRSGKRLRHSTNLFSSY